MIIKNLNPDEMVRVGELLSEISEYNPHLSWEAFPMESKPHPIHHVVHPEVTQDMEERLLRLEDKVDIVIGKLELIFGNHVIMDGRFINLTKLEP